MKKPNYLPKILLALSFLIVLSGVFRYVSAQVNFDNPWGCAFGPECGSGGSYDNGSGGGTTYDTCPDGSLVPQGTQCPPQTKTCWDGSQVDVSASCPEQCTDPAATNNGGAGTCNYPPSTKTCWDGSQVDVNASCPNQCTDPSATNNGGYAPCSFNNPPPPPAVCQDPNATNNGGALPCQYQSDNVCTDPSADNYAQSLPCQYPPQQFCNDPSADNYGAAGDCSYPPTVTSCSDPSATNYGGSLPCTYPQMCQDPFADNYGASGSCSYGSGNNTGDNGNPNGNGNGNNPGAPTSGFTLTGSTPPPVRFIASSGGQTNTVVSVNPTGGFSSPVTVSVQSTSCPNVTGYSFDGAALQSAPQATMTDDGSDNYRTSSGRIGLPVQVQFSQSFTSPCDIIFNASGSGDSATYDMQIMPNVFNPNFQEI